MTEQKSPSQEEPKGGVFDSIRGARSRDPEAVEEPKAAPETTEQEQPTQAAGEPAKRGDELTRASQRNAALERQLNEIGPFATFGMTVLNDKRMGKQLRARYERGEPLFTEEEIGAIEAEGGRRASEGESPMTPEDVANVVAERLDQRDAAARLSAELNGIAETELREFKKVSRSPEFMKALAATKTAVWNNAIPIDDDYLGWQNVYAAKEMTANQGNHHR